MTETSFTSAGETAAHNGAHAVSGWREATHFEGWSEANQRYLSAALALVRNRLETAAGAEAARERELSAQAALESAARAMPAPPAIERLATAFGLSSFERDTLILCAGVELDASVSARCAEAHGDARRGHVTFGLALASLPGAHWSALTASAPLRRFHLLEFGAGDSLTVSPLRIDERVLHYLAGVQQMDERLAALVEHEPPPELRLVPSQQSVVEQILATVRNADGVSPPVVALVGSEAAGKRALAAAVCAEFGAELYTLPAQLLSANPSDSVLSRLIAREAVLANMALLVDCDELDAADAGRTLAATRLLAQGVGLRFVTTRERRAIGGPAAVTFDVHKPLLAEQRWLWCEISRRSHRAVGSVSGAERSPASSEAIDQLVAQFDLGAAAIAVACETARSAEPAGQHGEISGDALWQACRAQARPQLDDLAQRIEALAAWEDLVLPDSQKDTLSEVLAQVRQRSKVYDSWGFAAKGTRGLGVSALFAGASGTGKTMAAEVLARQLRLDLYRVDLSQVVSKYIGETEKNLRRVFDAAEEGAAILLFDEADALFGKRSEVKDSHDRHANIEVSYLLQRMECYRGLALLTTNMKSALDTAFLRRIRFVLEFPFPDAAQRAEIWRRVFPARTPTEGLDFEKLSRMNVAGGNIRNIAINAAFIAAEVGEPVRMPHVLRAARAEYSKLERSFTSLEGNS